MTSIVEISMWYVSGSQFFMVSFPVLFWNCPSPVIPPSVFTFFASIYLLFIPSSVSVCSFCPRSCLRQFVPCRSVLPWPLILVAGLNGLGHPYAKSSVSSFGVKNVFDWTHGWQRGDRDAFEDLAGLIVDMLSYTLQSTTTTKCVKKKTKRLAYMATTSLH